MEVVDLCDLLPLTFEMLGSAEGGPPSVVVNPQPCLSHDL